MHCLKKALLDIEPSTTACADFEEVLSLLINIDSQLDADKCINNLNVKLLYSNNVIQGPTTLFCLSWNYLVQKDFKNNRHLDTDKIMYQFVHCFFSTPEDREFALHQLTILKSQPTQPQSTLSPDSHPRKQTPAAKFLFEQEIDRILTLNPYQHFQNKTHSLERLVKLY